MSYRIHDEAILIAHSTWANISRVATGNLMAFSAACRAYHRAMIAATPGLCVHEPDGTVRAIQTHGVNVWPDKLSQAFLATLPDADGVL